MSAAIAADQYRSVTAGFEAQRELTRAALSGDGPGDLLARLASHVDGWAALYDAAGTVVAAAPEWAARRAARLTADVARLGERPAPASAVVGGSDDRVELQSLGTGRRPHGALAVGTAAPLGTAERYAVHSAVALLTLTTERSRSLRAAEDRLGAAVLRMLLAGEPDHARTVAGDLYNGLLDAPYRLLIAEGAPVALQELAETLEAGASRAGEMALVVPEGERLVVLATDGGAAVTACTAYAQRIEARQAPGDTVGQVGSAGSVGSVGSVKSVVSAGSAGEDVQVVIGQSAPAGTIAAASAYRQAEQALSVARRRGRVLVEHEELATGSVVPLLADDAVRAFADGMLRPLHEHDATGRGDLVASLRAWLAHHGQWDAAAADLGVHRHTLRYRMRRVEEILGRSLDDPDVRMELWLALKATSMP